MTLTAPELSWAIILAGVGYSLGLLAQVPNGVFFNGDCGLKALLARQWSRGEFRFDLAPPTESWVRHLWRQGLYPYAKPFVYELDNRYYLSFPFTFSLITAPFYRLFGFRGLYLLPLVSIWTIWVSFYITCQSLNFNGWSTSLALTILIFGSNLTLYGAMYWEHTLAVSLAFAGMVIFSLSSLSQEVNGVSIPLAILSGCLVGLSVWIRSEFLAMAATLTALSLSTLFYAQGTFTTEVFEKIIYSGVLAFIVSMFLTVGVFFICNKRVYGRFLGIHSLLVLEEFSWKKRLLEAYISLKELIFSLFNYFPIAFFPALYLLVFLWGKINQAWGWMIPGFSLIIFLSFLGIYRFFKAGHFRVKSSVKQGIFPLIITITWLYFSREVAEFNLKMVLVYLLFFLFTVAVAILVDRAPDEFTVGGKQWGPRYLLILLPFISLLTLEQFNYFMESSPLSFRYITFATLFLLLIVGIYKNLYLGTIYFCKTHQNTAPAIQALQENPIDIVTFSHQHAAQALEFALAPDKFLFRAEDSQSLVKLGSALVDRGKLKFLYVCYPYRKCKPVEENPNTRTFNQKDQWFQIKLNSLGEFGKYPIYEASIVGLPPRTPIQ